MILLYLPESNASHPARGAWIEMKKHPKYAQPLTKSHPARGAWIEIQDLYAGAVDDIGRTPHGVRGLK